MVVDEKPNRFRTIASVLLLITLLILSGALVGGFLGEVHPLGDSLAVFRLPIAVAVSGICLVLMLMNKRSSRSLGVVIVLAVLAATPAALSYVETGREPVSSGTILYQKNLFKHLANPNEIVADIVQSGADIVMLEEVNANNLGVPDLLRPSYPFQKVCAVPGMDTTAVLTRLPLVEDGERNVLCGAGLAALRVLLNGQGVWIVAIHLHWPFPFDQDWHSRFVAEQLAELEGPMIIAGDFNMVPWGQSVQRIARASKTGIVGPTMTTLIGKPQFLAIPIDHVLLPRDWAVQKWTRPRFGSDHLGVVARFSMDEAEPEN